MPAAFPPCSAGLRLAFTASLAIAAIVAPGPLAAQDTGGMELDPDYMAR